MKHYTGIMVLFAAIFFIAGSSKQKNPALFAIEDKWSGTMSFLEKNSGPGIVIIERRIDASFTNNVGTASHKMKRELVEGDKLECNGEAKSELEVGFDEEKNTYSILAYVPACKGLAISAAGREWETSEEETGIQVDNQPIGINRNNLSGSLILKDSFPDGGRAITTYTWNLRKRN